MSSRYTYAWVLWACSIDPWCEHALNLRGFGENLQLFIKYLRQKFNFYFSEDFFSTGKMFISGEELSPR